MVDGRKRPEMELVMRARPRGKPLLLKLGVALALSFAGFLVYHLRSRSRPPAPPPSSSAGGKTSDGLDEELRIRKNEETLAKIINGTSTITTTTTTATTTTTLVGLSPTRKSSGDGMGFLLPEFNDLVSTEFQPGGRDVETTPTISTPKLESKEETAMEQEICHLRKLVWSLRERERSLELQLLEYYGMKEQESAIRELENQLTINSMETKLYSLKVDSLQAENLRLQSKLSDCSRAMVELNAARAKIKLLKKKLKSDAEQAKERIASLCQSISLLQCREQKEGRNDAEVERKLKRLEELEGEVTELRMVNSKLEREHSDLARRLEATQILASSVLEGSELEASDEINQLRQANDKLTKDLEQLRTDRCADVEELVYLRWVNACLRYELRNYQAPPGKTVARDLSKSLSPKSEEKAKQLILQYANPGADEKSLSLADFDSEYSSSSQASNGEPDDSCVDISMTKRSSSNNSKFFSKLKKLVLGKSANTNKISSSDRTPTSYGNSEKRASFSTFSIDEMIGRDSCNSLSSCLMDEPGHANQLAGMEAQPDEQHQGKVAQFRSHFRPSLDIQRLRKLNLEEVYRNDDETPYRYKNMDSREERSINLAQNNSLLDHKRTNISGKVELMKYADALKSTQEADKLTRRSSSFSN